MTSRCILLLAWLPLGGACGDEKCEDKTMCIDPHDFDRAGGYRALAMQVKFATETSYHFSTMNMSAETCPTTLARHVQEMRPLIADMSPLAVRLDSLIASRDPATPNHADATCIQAALSAEIEAHQAAGCMGATVDDSRAEAQRHIDAITVLTDQAIGRMDEVIEGLEREEEDPTFDIWTWTLPRACM